MVTETNNHEKMKKEAITKFKKVLKHISINQTSGIIAMLDRIYSGFMFKAEEIVPEGINEDGEIDQDDWTEDNY